MPRYYFDTHDGTSFMADAEGVDFPNLPAARRQAQAALADMAHDVVPGDGASLIMTCRVRDETGQTVLLRASLVLTVEEGP